MTTPTPAPTTPETLFTKAELGEYLQLPMSTLDYWRWNGKGPKATMVGKYVRYRLSDVAAWLEAGKVS